MTTTDAYTVLLPGNCSTESAAISITLVQHTATGTVYVKKILETYNADVSL